MSTSSQRWAIGAIVLAVLMACTPRSPEPAQPTPKEPQLGGRPLAGATAIKPIDDLVPDRVASPPGYAGEWALADEECGERAKTFRLSAEAIDMPPGKGSCAVMSISEEHPTGRSMNYIIKARCLIGAEPSEDTIAMRFGPSESVMEMQLNQRKPVQLMRCPEPQPTKGHS